MATDPDTGESATDESDEWRYSLSDLEDGAESEGDDVAVDEDADDDEGGIDAGVAGTFDVGETLEAQEVDLENAVFVVAGVVLALAFVAGFLNLWP